MSGPLELPSIRMEFPGELPCVREARRHIAGLLRGSPFEASLDDAVLLVSELVSNAVLHTRSGGAEGRFVVELAHPGEMVRIMVHDQGSHRVPTMRPGSGEGGRGLGLVDALADRWGAYGGHDGRCVWFELRMPKPPPS
ncbi:anti-sigma regulatory factor (Ser/Thr protein kinase) [Streptacidiphilus sp. MAP12-16]|uniref:ATP-binding protein n=1 Tax=Streptacidiphilus sp. MAP12-16 TaxID=3156300 RepID=UPI00351534F8